MKYNTLNEIFYVLGYYLIVIYGFCRSVSGYKQIAIGLLTDKGGCPIGVEIFKGSTSDQTTVLGEVKKLSEKYGLKNLIFTGD